MMRWFAVLLIGCCTFLPGLSQAKETKISLPQEIGRISRWAMQRRIDKQGSLEKAAEHEHWSWGGGVLMFGLVRAHRVTQDENIIRFVQHWADFHYEEGFPLNHTDRIMPAGVIAEMILEGKLPTRYDAVLKLSYDYLMAGKRVVRGCRDADGKRKKVQLEFRGRSWLDDLFMCGMFMTRYAEMTGSQELMDRVANQFLAHLDLLQCHGEARVLNHGQWLGRNGRPFLPSGEVAWARANGWYLAATADFLMKNPADNPKRAAMLRYFQEIMAEIPQYQLESGLFPTVLDKPSSYGEVAATALFVYASAAGLRQGWLKGDQYYVLMHRGLQAIMENVDANGQVVGISAGTPVLPTPRLYEAINRGTWPWGEGAVLLALVEVLDLVKAGKIGDSEVERAFWGGFLNTEAQSQ
ncbi:MAG: glycoside hydrolase family 88 protein [Bacteroidia bacterium]|nr:glycoside hydrolase family 88 protein [Bacteroidia bacterium]